MKLALHVEGATDRRVLEHIARVVLGVEVQSIVYPRRPGGWSGMITSLEAGMWHARKQGASGAIVAIDCNGCAPHESHSDGQPGDCRYCCLQREVLTRLRPLLDQGFSIVLAVPVQSIEAWLVPLAHRVGRRPHGPPQVLDSKEAKRVVWGFAKPTAIEIEAVLAELLPHMNEAELDRLAETQASFRVFRSELLKLKAAPSPGG